MANIDISRDVVLSEEMHRRIISMKNEKIKNNKAKIESRGGHWDTDDHGDIYHPDFKFEPIYEEGKDSTDDLRLIGKNVRKFLSEIPAYCFKDSALAGCWVGEMTSPRFTNFTIPYAELVPEDIRILQREYGLAPGIFGMNHMSPDFGIGLKLGFKGILDKILYYRDFNHPEDTTFYDAEEDTIRGILAFVENNAKYARKLAETEECEWRRLNYLKIAAASENLLTQPPKTFREACQFIAYYQSADRTYHNGGAMGQIDELLRPYFERDIRNGELTEEEAVWMVASVFYNDPHYCQIGGQKPDGTDIVSRVSYIILQAAHTLHIPNNLAIRVYEEQDDTLMAKGLSCIMEAGSGPCFSLAKGIEEGYMKQGHTRGLARMRAKVGCNWVALPGLEYPLQDVTRINFAQGLIHALDDLKNSDEEPTLEKLWERYDYHVRIMVDTIRRGYDYHVDYISKYRPELVINLCCHGPIERGVNCAAGGVDIINLNCDGMALATVADSFAAIEQRIVKEKKLTWQEMFEALDCNYEGKEDIRLMLKSIPRFGSPESLARKWAEKISKSYVEEMTAELTPRNHIRVVPGLFSHGDIYAWGKGTRATPNGRKGGEPISHSSEPDPGFAKGLTSFSPTLKATAVARVQPGWGNSAPLHLDIDSDMVMKNGGVDCLCALVKTHNEMGGTLINMNCVTKEQIMRAHADPDLEPDLVVRVTGYSAFFASLSKEYRQQVVDRYLTNN